MKILVACESSHVLTLAFRELGHEAFSVDLKPSEIPTLSHIKDDALKIAHNYHWDLMVAHPPSPTEPDMDMITPRSIISGQPIGLALYLKSQKL